MTWNYRIMKSNDDDEDWDWYTIREVFYDVDGNITGYTQEIAPGGDTAEGLLEVLGLMRNALDKPVLDELELIEQLNTIHYPVDKSIPVYHGFKWGGTHVGVDWIVPVGTPILCIKDGKVIELAQDSKTYGGYLIIKHEDGYASLYAHLSKLNVKKGDTVKAGDSIGLSGGVPGTPGAGASTGYHLHFEIRVPGHLDSNKFNVDPIGYLET